jgi:phage terminase large subunit-like protein
MAKTTTSSAELERLKLSAEVAWYLEGRDIPLPDCPPAIKTPEPGELLVDVCFDPTRVDRVLAAMRRMRHTKGRWARQPLVPDPWQVAYVIAPVFGWVRRNELDLWVRVISTLYADVPRKNGKTTLSGGIALYLVSADGEQGAEVYALAAGKDQARRTFDPVKQIAQKSPDLKPYIHTVSDRIIHGRSSSYFQVASSLADLIHGSNIHGAIVDELHVHRRPDLLEAVETGTGSRQQPLIAIITTADDGRTQSIYARKRQMIEQLAERVITDETTYGVIWCAGENDDPFVEGTWRKANPGYGTSPTSSYLKRAAKKAENSPADLASFQRLHLGIRAKARGAYISLKVWDRNASVVDEGKLTGRWAFGGLDLASTSDLTALAWVFPDGGAVDVLWRIWVPEASISSLDKRSAGAASLWVRQGKLLTTPGEVTDYDFIRRQINTDLDAFRVESIAYDPWNSTQLVTNLLADGAPMEKMRQGFASMSSPTKSLQRLCTQGTAEHPVVRHGGNPVARWAIYNLAVVSDPAGNVKPDRDKSLDKIDPAVALIMALAGAIANIEEEDYDVMETVYVVRCECAEPILVVGSGRCQRCGKVAAA